MATFDELLSAIDSPADSDRVRTLVEVDELAIESEEDLEEGEPQRSYLSNPAVGYQIMHVGGRVSTVFLYVEPAEGFASFAEPLPGGLSQGSTRVDVLAKFGVPERSGEAATMPYIDRQGAWDRFSVGSVRFHFQYSEPEQKIRLVTMMAAWDAP